MKLKCSIYGYYDYHQTRIRLVSTMRPNVWTFLTCLSIFKSCRGDACDTFESIAQFSDISEKCKTQMSTVCRTPELLWNFFDASGKFPMNGLSYSSKFSYGNFPQCLSINHMEGDENIKGKYCAVALLIYDLIPELKQSQLFTKHINDAEIQNEIYKSLKLRDPFSLRGETEESNSTESALEVFHHFSKISLCVPDACSPKEVGEFFLYGYIENVSIIFYSGDIIACQTVDSNTVYETGDIAFLTVLGILLVIMIGSTVYDYIIRNREQKPHFPILIAFSVLTNGQKLLHISKDTKEQITVFNGMRFISLCWVMSYHAVAQYQGGVLGIVNWPAVRKWETSWTNRYILSALLAVDTFFFISGFVLAYGYFKQAPTKNLLTLLKEVPSNYLHRYLRITPAAGSMFLFTITIFRFLGTGPLWNAMISVYKTTCERMWWKFFLYIQNYTNPDDMCVNPTWYLSADMQMFFLAPLVLIPTALFIKKRFKHTMFALIGVTIVSIIVPPIIRYASGEAGNIYTSHERFNNFLIGITFGAFMRFKRDKPFIFSPGMNIFLWGASIIVSLAFNIYWFDVIYRYDLLKYTLFMAFYRPVWCLCLVFMVYSCYHGQGGVVNWFLSWPTFQILARLSFSMYVLHVHVEAYAFATIDHDVYFSDYLLFYSFCGHLIVTMLAAVVWVLAFEMPMITIEKILRGLFSSGSGTHQDKRQEKVNVS